MIIMRNSFNTLMILMAAMLLVLALQNPAWSAGDKLRVLYSPYLGSSAFFIAHEEGYFTEQGLEIEFVKMKRSPLGLPPLIQGKLDVLSGATTFAIFNAIDSGGDIKIVAGKGYYRPKGCSNSGIIARTDLGLDAANLSKEKLAKLRLATNPKSPHAYGVEKFLGKYGLSLKDITLVDVPNTLKIKALQNDSVDLLTASEPWLSRIVDSGHGKVLVGTNQILPDYDISTLQYGPSLLKDRPDLGIKFMKAYLKGVQTYLQGKTKRNLEIIAKHTKLPQTLLKKACWTAARADGKINTQGVLGFQKWAHGKGRLNRIIPPEQFWEPKFIEQAKP